METKVIFRVIFAAVIFAISEVNSATYFSTHGNRAPSIASTSSHLRSRLRTRQTANAAQQPQAYAYQQPQSEPAASYPTSNLIYYPAQNSNPLTSQQQLRVQNPQVLQQPQQLAQFLQQQQQQQQQLYQQQQVYQLQPQAQFQQQQLLQPQEQAQQYTGGPIPGGVRYIFTTGVRPHPSQLTATQRQPQPQVVEEPSSAAEPAAVGQLGVSYSPASAVSTIKFSNPYANYSYG